MVDTTPKNWFIPSVPFTEGNSVVALVDGSDFMKHLYERLMQMGNADELFYSAWRASPGQTLRPDLKDVDTRLQPVLLELVKRGVIVRILAWAVPLYSLMAWYLYNPLSWVIRGRVNPALQHPKEQRSFVEEVRRAIAAKGSGGGAYLDDRLPLRASHHQKFIVLSIKGDYWAYVGGIDIALDRWDNANHDSPKERQDEILFAWHDVHCVIQGPAVKEIWSNFKDRWNDPTPPLRGNGPGSHERTNSIREVLNVPANRRGSINIQRLRTLACGVYSFKQDGEKTSLQGINRAVDQAQHYIYIEDQYLWPCSTIDHLARAMRDRGVHVYLVLAKEYDLPVIAIAHYEMRRMVLATLRKAGGDKLVCCHLEQSGSSKQIYVHSKFMIVDDCFVAIGSTNVGLRSHTTDSELHVGLVDSDLIEGIIDGRKVQVCRFAKELRIRIWKEHLNVPDAALLDPIAAKSQWPRQGEAGRPTKVHHAVYHSGDVPPRETTISDWYNALKVIRDFLKQPQPLPNISRDELGLIDEAVQLFDRIGYPALEFGKWDLLLGPIWWTPTYGLKARIIKLIQEKLMNLETKCSDQI